jgi:general secretion pathway protein K
MSKKSMNGSALISALFIMTLIAIAATAMTLRLQLDIYRTRLLLTTNKQHYAAQFATFWAIDTLKNP